MIKEYFHQGLPDDISASKYKYLVMNLSTSV